MGTSRVRVGDIVAIPVSEETTAVAVILHISRYFRNAVMLGFFKVKYGSVREVNISELQPEFIWIPNYTSKREIAHGSWQIIGSRVDLAREELIPYLTVVNELFFKDDVVRIVSDEEAEAYSSVVVSGGGAIEKKLRDYFLKWN